MQLAGTTFSILLPVAIASRSFLYFSLFHPSRREVSFKSAISVTSKLSQQQIPSLPNGVIHRSVKGIRHVSFTIFPLDYQLHDWGYKGHLTLYGNNEPWLDTRIVAFHKYAREKLPDAFITLSGISCG